MTLAARAGVRRLRRDALARRERLIEAAVELFASDGPNVPLEKVAERAGVGRATLYRNFPDRQARASSVLQAHLDILAAAVARAHGGSGAFFAGLRALAVTAGGVFGPEARRAAAQSSELSRRFRAAVGQIMAEPLGLAKAERRGGSVKTSSSPTCIWRRS